MTNRDIRLRRMGFRAWHRGTKEADLLIGGFYDTHAATLDDAGLDWLEALLAEEDVEIMGWALGTIAVPPRFAGPLMDRLARLDYIPVAR